MYKAVIFYFSGTGNTWWVADKIKRQLDSSNINADIVSIENMDAKKADWWIKTADLVFFGWPVYGSDMPKPMKEFIDNLLVNEKGKHIHTFCTQMRFSGDGAWQYHKHFEKKGLTIDSAQHFIMPSNLSSSNGIIGAPRNETKSKKILERCEEKVEDYIRNLLSGKAAIKGRYSYTLGMLQRAPYRLFYKNFEKSIGSDGVNKERCNSCGICSRICPVSNIKMNNYPEFQGRCALCFRCYALCPESAITINGKTRDIKKYGKPYSIHDKRFKSTLIQ